MNEFKRMDSENRQTQMMCWKNMGMSIEYILFNINTKLWWVQGKPFIFMWIS